MFQLPVKLIPCLILIDVTYISGAVNLYLSAPSDVKIASGGKAGGHRDADGGEWGGGGRDHGWRGAGREGWQSADGADGTGYGASFPNFTHRFTLLRRKVLGASRAPGTVRSRSALFFLTRPWWHWNPTARRQHSRLRSRTRLAPRSAQGQAGLGSWVYG